MRILKLWRLTQFPHMIAACTVDAPEVAAGSCWVAADWSILKQLEVALKLNLWLYKDTFCAFITSAHIPHETAVN